jgi:hypothetical protein
MLLVSEEISRVGREHGQHAHQGSLVAFRWHRLRRVHFGHRRYCRGHPCSGRRKLIPWIKERLDQLLLRHFILPELLLLAVEWPMLDLGLHKTQEIRLLQISGKFIVRHYIRKAE